MKNKNLLVYILEIESSETLGELKESLIRYIQDGEKKLTNIEDRLDSATVSI